MNKYKPLSEKYWKTEDGKRIIRYEDVAQLIKDLKERVNLIYGHSVVKDVINQEIDKLAGDFENEN